MKKIIISIDVSKKTLDATAIKLEIEQLGYTKLDYQVFDNSPMGFRRMLVWGSKLVPGIALEDVLFICETTGAYDRALCDYIFGKGYDIWRESALQIKESSGLRKGKNDKADSLMIAEYAMRHMDKVHLYQSTDGKILEVRALLLYRRKLEQEKTSKLVRVKELKATAAKSKSLTFILRDANKSIRALEKSIAECESQIQKLINADEDLKKTYTHLDSIKGIGIVNATALIVYTNNFKNFRTSRQLASYYGVASFRNKSGETIDKRADVSCYSSSMLKSYITQAAECTIKSGGIYKEYYDRMRAKGKLHGIAINNIKNKLLHLAFSLVANDCDYEENHEFLRAQRLTTSA